MRRGFDARIALFAPALAVLAAAAGARAAEAASGAFAYACDDAIEGPVLSADGAAVAFVLSDGRDRSLAVYHVASAKTEVLFHVTSRSLGYEWKGDRILVCQDLGDHLSIVSVTPGQNALNSFPGYGRDRLKMWVRDWLPGDPGHILVQAGRIGIMDVITGDVRLTQPTDQELFSGPYIADRAGNLRLRCIQGRGGIELQHRRSDGDAFETIYHWSWEEPVANFLGFGSDPNIAYFLTHTDGEWGEIKGFDLRSATFGEPIVKGNGAELVRAVYSRDHSSIIGVVTNPETGRRIVWIDPAARHIQATLDASLPGRRNEIASLSQDCRTAVVLSIARSEPGEYLVLDLRKGALVRLGPRRDKVAYASSAEETAVEISARDGLKIHAILVEPPGPRKVRAAVVIPNSDIFGERSGTYYWNFAQYLASEGYAVLRVDFRGCSGYGNSYKSAGRHQFARKVPEDVEDATGWLVSSRLAAPGRIAIEGDGVGATIALMVATHAPDAYACVVNEGGAVDLSSIESTGEDSWLERKRNEMYFSDDPAVLESMSALKSIGRLRGPIFNLYPSASRNQAWSRLESALKSAHRPYSVWKEPKVNPLPTADLRTDRYEQINAFLLQNLPPN